MARIIAPACPYCSAMMGVQEMFATFGGESHIDPIDINLIPWYVGFKCVTCGYVLIRLVGEVMAEVQDVRPAV